MSLATSSAVPPRPSGIGNRSYAGPITGSRAALGDQRRLDQARARRALSRMPAPIHSGCVALRRTQYATAALHAA